MFDKLRKQLSTIHEQSKEASAVFKYIGPGILVTVGFIDPGNWAVNLAAGAHYGYSLLWVVTLSTIMLILLQHNAAHLGIVTGECLAEAASKFLGHGCHASFWARLCWQSLRRHWQNYWVQR